MIVVALERIQCKPFCHSAEAADQCRIENRKRRTVRATEPNQAAFEIALPHTCESQIHVADEISPARAGPTGIRAGFRFGRGDRRVGLAV